MSKDDGHGPKAGCGWQQCGVEGDADKCPFTRDAKTPVPGTAPRDIADAFSGNHNSHRHEWRQLIIFDEGGNSRWNPEFYCIHCLKTTEK